MCCLKKLIFEKGKTCNKLIMGWLIGILVLIILIRKYIFFFFVLTTKDTGMVYFSYSVNSLNYIKRMLYYIN
jgi:hypothetical protein